MGKCLSDNKNKKGDVYSVDKTTKRGVTSKSMMSTQTDTTTTRLSTLEMQTGFEDLYSKVVNIHHFEQIRVIGRGSFGKVLLIRK